jgi:hypothetical protein
LQITHVPIFLPDATHSEQLTSVIFGDLVCSPQPGKKKVKPIRIIRRKPRRSCGAIFGFSVMFHLICDKKL